ncbi:lipase secretion chaperone [Duganella zoogloeoides]|uniref:Lipase helper protein n=1 Tax=Duganella zoogloeoides TaxID=75659 RepID=A0ABZ0Y3Z2_9BURK|nr:lipase secretion chaperone [Duganella zoogloeoides]WQH06766.1 lipase secretion chaperone [Duganella zoogloeoides]
MQAAPMVAAATLVLAATVLAAAMAPGMVAPGLPLPATAARPADHAMATGAAGTPGGPMPAPPGAAGDSPPADQSANTATAHARGALLPAVPPDLALTDDQRLVADHALRMVMERYLNDRRNPQRLQQLNDHLHRRLPGGAAAEAQALAARYDRYLAAHATLLAAQNLGDDPDLHRLASWQAQRRQLRERLLGAEVADQWFGTEDAYLEQALAEAREPAAGPAHGSARAATEEERLHAQHMREVIDAAIGRAPR